MTEYKIVEREDKGFTSRWNIKAKSLTAAKRKATDLQVYVNTIITIYERIGNDFIERATRGPLESANGYF